MKMFRAISYGCAVVAMSSLVAGCGGGGGASSSTAIPTVAQGGGGAVALATSAPIIPSVIYSGNTGWTVQAPGDATPSTAFVTPPNGFWTQTGQPYPVVWISNSLEGGVTDQPFGLYKYFYSFSLAPANQNLQSIGDLHILADNCAVSVTVNGKSISVGDANNCSSFANFDGTPLDVSLASFLSNADIKANNLIEIDVYNSTSSDSPTGLFVYSTPTLGTCVP